MNERPRVLFVGRSRYRLPLAAWLARKWDAVEEQLDYRILGAAEDGSPTSAERFRLAAPARPRVADAPLFYARLPFRVARQLREWRPAAVVAADPFVGAAVLAARRLARSDAKLIVEVHGDWRTFTRGYGSPARRSDLEAPEFRARQTINGTDLAKLAQDSIELASKTGHMKYRTVSVYPQVDQQLNKAIELIVTDQLSARQALQQAQAASLAELSRAGVKI